MQTERADDTASLTGRSAPPARRPVGGLTARIGGLPSRGGAELP